MSDILVLAGTRPEVIKLASTVIKLQEKGLPYKFIVIQQHHELLEDALGSFPQLKASIIRLEKHTGPSEYISSACRPLAKEIEQAKIVIVQGDTMTAMLGAELAVYSRKKVAHIEAGLRSGSLAEPWPEEGIRRAIDHMSSIHFSPTTRAQDNLAQEGIKDSVTVTGNTVADAVFMLTNESEEQTREHFVLSFLHRWENLNLIEQFFLDFLERYHGDVYALAHPTTLRILTSVQDKNKKLKLLKPIGYVEMLKLIQKSKAIITDSGGIQEEASLLGTPCFLFRRCLDRPESVEIGQAKQVKSGLEAAEFLQDEMLINRMSFPSTVYGDGLAAERIVHVIDAFLRETA